MSFITESWFIDVLLGLTLIVFAVYYYLTSGYDYWKKKNVPYPEPTVGFGNLLPLIKKDMNYQELLTKLYNQFEGERFIGFFQYKQPTLMIRDPKLIEQVLIKDFSYFEDRLTISNDDSDPLSVNLVTLTGKKWRSLRHKLTPTFSSGKLKGLFRCLCECGEDLLQKIEKLSETEEIIECKDLAFSFSTDVIATCAFGLEIKNKEEVARFKEMVNKAQGKTRFSTIRFSIRLFAPKLANFLGVRALPSDANDYFMSITKQTIEHRMKNNIKRDDFFQLLLTLKERDETGKNSKTTIKNEDLDQDDLQLKYNVKSASSEHDFKITEDVIAAESFVFLSGGSDTVATTISVVLHFLAENSHVQEKLQEEIDSVLEIHGGVLTYQAVKDLIYLDQVIQESQRIFPIAHIHSRVCTSPYKIPGSDVVLEKGISVTIPVLPIHLDPKYYPDPETFDPDRFVGNNFKPSAIFSPFGDGPRICIAMRFAILEVKVFIARVISRYSVKPTSKTKKPLRYDPKTIHATPEGGVWVTFEKRNF